jgi:hypothetical protein
MVDCKGIKGAILCECETWSLVTEKIYKLGDTQERVLGSLFQPKRE